MSDAARTLLLDVLALPEDERLELASEILASVGGPRDAGWEAAWLEELDRRSDAVKPGGVDLVASIDVALEELLAGCSFWQPAASFALCSLLAPRQKSPAKSKTSYDIHGSSPPRSARFSLSAPAKSAPTQTHAARAPRPGPGVGHVGRSDPGLRHIGPSRARLLGHSPKGLLHDLVGHAFHGMLVEAWATS